MASSSSLVLRAGPAALRRIREGGLRAEDVDVLPGASGGPKWLVLGGLDRFLFGDFLAGPRTRPLHLIGSSIGSWRMACFAQRDPLAALARAHEAYIEQRYDADPPAAVVSATSRRILDVLLGDHGADEILANDVRRLHVVTAACRGPVASERRWVQATGLALAAAGNLVARRTLAWHMRRVVYHVGGDSGFRGLSDLPTEHRRLTAETLRPALIASGSVPLVLEGVRVPDGGLHRDGGIIDYHLDLDFGAGEGIVLYPHFFPHVVPGWFDKALAWRRAPVRNFGRALLVSPSPSFVASLPGGKIPDRNDFYRFPEAERIRRWRAVLDASRRPGDELAELIATGRIADAVRPW